MEILIAEKVSLAYGLFCHAIRANGFLFCSGITPINADRIVEDKTVQGQTGKNQVVKTIIYLKDYQTMKP